MHRIVAYFESNPLNLAIDTLLLVLLFTPFIFKTAIINDGSGDPDFVLRPVFLVNDLFFLGLHLLTTGAFIGFQFTAKRTCRMIYLYIGGIVGSVWSWFSMLFATLTIQGITPSVGCYLAIGVCPLFMLLIVVELMNRRTISPKPSSN